MEQNYGRKYNLSLIAGVESNLGFVQGSHYRLVSTSVGGSIVSIQFNDNGAFIDLEEGEYGEFKSMNNVRLLSTINQMCVLYLGAEPLKSDKASVALGGVTATWSANNGGASPLDVAVLSLTAAVISVARAAKRSTFVYNPSTNANNFRVGVGAAAGAGLLLEPGMGIELDGTMAISAYNEGALAESLTVTELDLI